MPTQFILDSQKKIVYSTANGHLTLQEMLDHLGTIRQHFLDGKLDDQWAQIINFLDVDSMEGVNAKAVRELIYINPWPGGCPRAIITTDKFLYGLSRMYQNLGDFKTMQVGLVHNLEEAESYISQCRETGKPSP